MKLTEEAENGPDDDNLFADPGQKSRPTTSQTGGYRGKIAFACRVIVFWT